MAGLPPQPPNSPTQKILYVPPDINEDLPQGEALYTISRNIRDILIDLKSHRLHDTDIPDLDRIHDRTRNITNWIADIINSFENNHDEDIIEQELTQETVDASPVLEPDISKPTPPLNTTTTVPTSTNDTQPTTITQAHAPTANLPQAAQQPNSTKQRAQKRPRRVARARTHHQERTTPTTASTRLVVRFAGDGIPADVRPHPATFRDSLNTALHMRAVEGIQYSRAGQLILHTLHPYTAQQLAPLADQMWPVIQAAFRIADTPHRPIFEPDDAWTRIVVHQVPVPVWDGKKDAQATHEEMTRDLCQANLLPAEAVRQMRWLCSKDEEARRIQSSTSTSPTFVSIMLALHGPNIATALWKRGVVASGALCAVTNYKTRPRTRPSGPHA